MPAFRISEEYQAKPHRTMMVQQILHQPTLQPMNRALLQRAVWIPGRKEASAKTSQQVLTLWIMSVHRLLIISLM